MGFFPWVVWVHAHDKKLSPVSLLNNFIPDTVLSQLKAA
jgi:hypothetical protein